MVLRVADGKESWQHTGSSGQDDEFFFKTTIGREREVQANKKASCHKRNKVRFVRRGRQWRELCGEEV